MALRLAGEDTGIQERVESIAYSIGLQDSGDLEATTKTITATTKPATPDYTSTLTIPAVPDNRLEVLRTAIRVQIDIDSFGSTPVATKLFCTVEVNGVEKLSAVEFTAVGANLAAVDLTAGFNLGSANTLEVFLWVDQGEVVVSLAQLWMTVGTTLTSGRPTVLKIRHSGLLALASRLKRVGTGTPILQLCPAATAWVTFAEASGFNGILKAPAFVCISGSLIVCYGTVTTDLNYVENIYLHFRSVS